MVLLVKLLPEINWKEENIYKESVALVKEIRNNVIVCADYRWLLLPTYSNLPLFHGEYILVDA